MTGCRFWSYLAVHPLCSVVVTWSRLHGSFDVSMAGPHGQGSAGRTCLASLLAREAVWLFPPRLLESTSTSSQLQYTLALSRLKEHSISPFRESRPGQHKAGQPVAGSDWSTTSEAVRASLVRNFLSSGSSIKVLNRFYVSKKHTNDIAPRSHRQ